MRKKQGKGKIILGSILVLLLLSFVWFVQISSITVTGNSRYTDEQIIDKLFAGEADRNFAYCYLKNRWKEKQEIPFVETYKIVFQSPTKVEVIVYEKSVVGYVSYMSSNLYFDKDGIIVESTSEKLDDIPWITGLDFGHIVLYQPLPVGNSRIFDYILNLTQLLSVNEIQVDKILYDSRGETSLFMDEIEVVMGNAEDQDGKISILSDMLPELNGKKGVLYLDTYKENDSGKVFSFIPK